MSEQITLLRETASIKELANRAIEAVVEGNIDPITAHINISRMEAAIKQFKDNSRVKEIMLRELAKYGKKQSFGDCVLEERESAVKYDYTACGDSVLLDMYSSRDAILANIKEREAMLRNLPVSGMVSPETGEMLFPPARSSKTTIFTTFKK